VDITQAHSEQEFEPFFQLIKQGKASMVMVGHLMHRSYDAHYPFTLSENACHKLLRQRNFQGVLVSDDLHMGAILKNFSLTEVLTQAIKASMDLLVFSNNPSAAKGVKGFRPDPDLPEKCIEKVLNGVEQESITALAIEQSFRRIRFLKRHQ